jgi:DNA-binding transcriptional LysR family regulator
MELRDIEYFSVVAKHGHLGRAAEVLGLSQSALSKSLRRLEHEMHSKLVKRTPKGVELTAEGATLLARAHRLRLSLDDIAREVADVKQGLAGHLRVGSGTGFSFHLLPSACSTLAKEAPNVTLMVRDMMGGAVPAVRTGELDLAVMAMRSSLEPDLAQEYLYEEEYVVCASANHRLVKKRGLTLADLVQERWSVAEPPTSIRQHIHQVFAENGLPAPRITVETANPALRLVLVESSDVLGYTWSSVVRQFNRGTRLVELRVKELNSSFRVVVIYRKDGYLSTAARRFIEILKATAKKLTTSRQNVMKRQED